MPKWYGKMALMNAIAPIDKAGRVVIPKAIREALDLTNGDNLDISVVGEEIRLRLTPRPSALKKEGKVWVHSSGAPMDSDLTAKTVARIRRERSERILGLR